MAGINDLWNTLGGIAVTPGREFANFLDSIGSFISSKPQAAWGQGAGDQVFGLNGKTRPKPAPKPQASFASAGAPQQLQDTQLPSYDNAFQHAMEILGGAGYTPAAHVNYDPLRQDAQHRAGEYDAKLAAMYDQLQNSIRGDAAGLSQSYDTGISDAGARSAQTQQQIAGAANAADARNLEVLKALGQGDAAANIIAKGQDVNTQTANNQADAAARGQITQDQLGGNKQAALTHNTNLVSAAGFSGAEQRGRVQDELSSLLANYAMQEQQANQGIDQQNAAGRNSFLSQQLGLANNLLSNDWQTQDYNDKLAAAQAQAQAAGAYQPNMAANYINQLAQGSGLKLGSQELTNLVNAINTANKGRLQ